MHRTLLPIGVKGDACQGMHQDVEEEGEQQQAENLPRQLWTFLAGSISLNWCFLH